MVIHVSRRLDPVTPIRPQAPHAPMPAKPAADARNAFFQAVRGPAALAPAQAPQSRPQPPALAATRVQAEVQPTVPTRHLRPGSLLDIKV
jgi:hypothetical protein